MSNPLWPDPATLPFKLFGQSGEAPSAVPAFSQGLDLVKKFWGNLPGGTALPGFLVPTVDVAELDKRLSDLRAAESWVEVNLNMLRATIQGLEVQRNTIATIQSLSAMAEGVMAGKAPAPADAPASGLPAGWPMTPPAAAAPPTMDVTPPASPIESAAPPAVDAPAPTTGIDPVVGLATNNWLGFMQEQFMKVAQAAVAPPVPDGVSTSATRGAARKPSAKSAKPAASRKAKRRSATAR